MTAEGKIIRLPAGLANQIAAGEVVERPASAVKELVENALDAGATRIVITIEFGGKRLIRVEDDGEGMTAADAALAVERHATSKIARAEDLAAIATLGFRGEALPSIGSVSRLRLRTRARDAGDGVEVRVAGGGAAEVAPAGAPPGTVVEVRDLFYNVPARRKFLKSDGAETGHISRGVTQLALGFFEIGFTLISGPRTLIDCAPAASLAERFQQIYGERPDLVEVRKEAAGIRLVGFAASLAGEAPANGPQHLFVNRRAVKDKTIAHAIGEAYRRATIKPRRPEAHLFLEVPPQRVDVNVHPAKTEVRFLEQSLVHEVVRRALGAALGQEVVPQVPLERPAAAVPEPRAQSIPGVLGGLGAASRWGPVTDMFRRQAPREDGRDMVRDSTAAAVDPAAAGDLSAMGTGPLIPLGQCRDTFIVAVDNDGIVIIDQHVAHERILFEQVMRRLTEGPVQAQRLLDPLVITLPPAGRAALAAHAGDLARLGFEIEPFGGDSVQVAAVPSLLGRAVSEAAIRALAEDLEGLERGTGAAAALGRIAATTACHAAVKANDRLTMEKMSWLLRELRHTAYSTVCPHGRPVLLRLSRQELEKRFERI
ncbi:MAG: DNA mismatch repair endonuclease MutL [Acidobacteria bacterium]|nr:DNA mismatch repair endonuclease MutL [Acidobacteriota bacterium]